MLVVFGFAVGVGVVGVAGGSLVYVLDFVCFHGCHVLSKLLFVYLFQVVFLCQPYIITVG